MPRLFSGLGDPLALVPLTGGSRLPLGTGTPQFQTESRLNLPLHRPSSVEALEILHNRGYIQKAIHGALGKRD